MGIEAILLAILPIILKGIAAAVEAYNQGKIDEAQLKAQVQSALEAAKVKAADLMSDFSQAHIDAFLARLHAATPHAG